MMILILFLTTLAQASDLKFSRVDYEAAEKAPVYFKFTGHSRKLGIFGTSFSGYAKEATLHFDRKGSLAENVTLSLPVIAVDTDNGSRNEKMWNTCLSEKEFPLVRITLTEGVDLDHPQSSVSALMEVRGKTIPLSLTLEKTGEHMIKGKGTFKLSEAGIPDPSIAIASVKDEFELEFQVDVTEPQ